MVARGLNKAQFICCISRFVTWFPTIPHISSVQLAKGVLYPSYFPHLSARFKLLHVMVVLFLLLEFLPSCFQAENQIYKSKAMGERHQDWRAFKSFQSSQSFREWNKQEIKMKLEMVENPLFRRLKPGAFLWYILSTVGNEASQPLLNSLQKEMIKFSEKCQTRQKIITDAFCWKRFEEVTKNAVMPNVQKSCQFQSSLKLHHVSYQVEHSL